jgi:hypothetical protein
MFLNNLEPTFYAIQRQVDANKCVEAQRPGIDGLMDIDTFEFIQNRSTTSNTISRPHMDIQTQTTS